MNLQILISTMNRKHIEELDLNKKNVKTKSLIINQTNNSNKEIYNNYEMINLKEKGLSKSRNRAIQNASEDICLICDDDVNFIDGFEKKILNAFNQNPDFDIISFKIITPEGNEFKTYEKESFNHNKRSILKVSSIEVAFRLKSIKDKCIKFDEKFGLGGQYISGEENIFLSDCLKNGLKIKYEPIEIAIHERESSGKILNEKAIYSKGALFYRLFGLKSIYINLGFILKKRKEITFNIIKAIYTIYRGTIDYIYMKED